MERRHGNNSKLHSLQQLVVIAPLSLLIGCPPDIAERGHLGEVSLDDLPMRCVSEILGAETQPVEHQLSDFCREQVRLLTGEMSPPVRPLYDACIEQLQIDPAQKSSVPIRKACRRRAEGDSGGAYEIGREFEYAWSRPRDLYEAARWYEESAKQGNPEAQHSLGLLHTRPAEYLGARPSEAIKWFRAGADQGHAGCQYSLGRAYEDGLGVPKDYGEAAHWYKESALQGDVLAMSDLALLFHRGLGVERSIVSAYAWMNVASAQEGWSVLSEERDQFEKEMKSDQIAEAQALSSQLQQQLSARSHAR